MTTCEALRRLVFFASCKLGEPRLAFAHEGTYMDS